MNFSSRTGTESDGIHNKPSPAEKGDRLWRWMRRADFSCLTGNLKNKQLF